MAWFRAIAELKGYEEGPCDEFDDGGDIAASLGIRCGREMDRPVVADAPLYAFSDSRITFPPPSAALLRLFRRIKQKITPPMIASTASPPTIPPAIAPTGAPPEPAALPLVCAPPDEAVAFELALELRLADSAANAAKQDVSLDSSTVNGVDAIKPRAGTLATSMYRPSGSATGMV